MRKLIVFNMVSLDGFFADVDGGIGWHVVDAEFNRFAVDQLHTVDALVFGRKTFDLMAEYWTTADAIKDDPEVAERMNSLPKIVVSTTRIDVENWQNSRVLRGSLPEAINALKQQPGRDLIVFGSGELVSALTNHGLVDEYRLMIAPVILGKGRSQFEGVTHNIKLKALTSRPFASGALLLTFQPG